MPVATNTVVTTGLTGIREDLGNAIALVDPIQTPLMTEAGTATPGKSYYSEWQTRALAPPDLNNAQLEGDVTVAGAVNNTARVGNHAQILKKVISVSGSARAVEAAGREDEFDTQLEIKTKELKRDIELAICSSKASVARTDSVAGQLAGVQAWCTSNVSRGVGGLNGGFAATIVAAPTDGALRNLTEALFIPVMQSLFASNGTTGKRVAYMSGPLKSKASAFVGLALNRIPTDMSGKGIKVVGSVEGFQSDFGLVMFVPHPYAFTRAMLIADLDYIKMKDLQGRGFKIEKLAKNGDADNAHILYEGTLQVENQRALGLVADVQ